MLGIPSADQFLASITKAQWAECVEYAKIRGPIGPHRFDTLAAMISMHAARVSYGRDVELAEFMPPWIPQPDDGDVDD